MVDLHGAMPAETKMPLLSAFNQRDPKSEDQRGRDLRVGFSLDLWIELGSTEAGQALSTAAIRRAKASLS